MVDLLVSRESFGDTTSQSFFREGGVGDAVSIFPPGDRHSHRLISGGGCEIRPCSKFCVELTMDDAGLELSHLFGRECEESDPLGLCVGYVVIDILALSSVIITGMSPYCPSRSLMKLFKGDFILATNSKTLRVLHYEMVVTISVLKYYCHV